jgi:glycyl-tRNA synthetase
MSQLMQHKKFKCTSCGTKDFAPPRMFNLLMQTACGSVPTYLRPETAQGIFLNYDRVRTSMRKALPFGVGQVGKAFRNEISPRDFVYRMREFEQMELEYFCHPHEAPAAYTELVAKCRGFLAALGVRPELLRVREYHGAELAHYAAATTDIEFHFPFGWGELWGVANRGDFDLRRHALGLTTVASREDDPDPAAPADRAYPHQFYPHVVEPSVGVDRLLLAVVHSALRTEDVDGKRRTVMHLHPDLAPIKLAVLPLTKAPELRALAKELFEAASQHWACDLDHAGSIGKRYARNDEVGTPWCVTVDQDSLANHTVTVRSRDSRAQVTMSISELMQHIKSDTRLPL